MNGYERMMTAVRGGQPDCVPLWELIVNRPVIEALHGDCSYFDFVEREDLDGVTIFEDQQIEERSEGVLVDEWGIHWKNDAAGIPYRVAGPVRSEADLDHYRAPDPYAAHRFKTLEEAVARFKGERAVVFLTHDAFEFSHYLFGMENLLMAYALNPALAHRLARLVVDYKRRVLEGALEVGADIALTGDDYADNHAPLMSPVHFQEFVGPYLAEMVDTAHAGGVPFIKHTDGRLWPIMDQLLDTGLDCLDPIEPAAGMDIGDVKQKYGDRIAVAGNVDCSDLLSRGTPEQVVEAVKETLAKAAVGGGHILASSNSIHPAVKPENYAALVRAGREFGRYPLDPEMVQEYRTRNYISQWRS